MLTIVLIAVAARLWPRRRELLTGAAVGIAIHLWRDMADPHTGVAMLWPISDATWSVSHLSYLLLMGGVAAIGLRRCLGGQARAQVVHR
jgi:membrane-bound metal-dependent hydrolase YbcI (DUF457 family)